MLRNSLHTQLSAVPEPASARSFVGLLGSARLLRSRSSNNTPIGA